MKIAVVEDDSRYRSSLETLFAYAPEFALEASFESAEDALQAVAEQSSSGRPPDWDLVLIDLGLPGLDGVEATRRLKKQLPELPIVILTVFEKPATILEAIIAGADGYLLKKTPPDEMLSQLKMIKSGGAPLTAGVARTVIDLLRAVRGDSAESSQPASDSLIGLTQREHEVLQCLVRGMAYKQVADCLEISIDTVRTHIRAVYRKLQVHSVSEAVVKAIREELV